MQGASPSDGKAPEYTIAFASETLPADMSAAISAGVVTRRTLHCLLVAARFTKAKRHART